VKIYRDKTISDQTFVLEECVFYDCLLKNCDIFYPGGEIEFVNLKLDNTRIHFRGAASNTERVFRGLGMLAGNLQPSMGASLSVQKPN
jgi:hypothetical protein